VAFIKIKTFYMKKKKIIIR